MWNLGAQEMSSARDQNILRAEQEKLLQWTAIGKKTKKTLLKNPNYVPDVI